MLIGEVALNLPRLKGQLEVERELEGGRNERFYLMSAAAPSHQCLAHGEYSEIGPSTETGGKFHPESFSLSSGRGPLDHAQGCPSLCTSRGTLGLPVLGKNHPANIVSFCITDGYLPLPLSFPLRTFL